LQIQDPFTSFLFAGYFVPAFCFFYFHVMNFREAVLADIPQLQLIRNSVKENALSDPTLVSFQDYVVYLTERGKGWVCESNGQLVGFSIADIAGKNIWALFVLPGFEKQGIGKELHKLMMDWYFSQTSEKVWLSTAPRSRAEAFYRKAGWKETGTYGKNEIKFEMSLENWRERDI
jgi:GNAT superfamily N-acetyltransferase